ncbi:MAG: succinate dehydrogenase, cytochrome b556 subunit [Pseudomonadota bacterium]
MADVNRGNRPLSPHLTIYRPQITSMLSIMHRMTGIGLVFATALIVWWLLAAATSAVHFAFIDGLLTSWVGLPVLLGISWAMSYHFCNGIRHLIWDMGFGFEIDKMELSGKIVVGASFLLTALVWIVA